MAFQGLEGFEDVVETCMRIGDIPGVVVGIVDRAGTRYTGGFGLGHIGRRTAPDDRSRFCIQSCTKAFMATTVAILVEKGLVDWDLPIHTVVPEFRLSDPAATRLVSFRDLLAHRTGLPAGHDWMRITSPLAPGELLERLACLELRRPPREAFEYSNLMYVIGGAVVERLTGTSWEQFLRQHILGPLGMSDTALDSPGEDAPDAMPDYARDGQDWVTFPSLWEPKLWRALMSATSAPCGGIVSTVRDLCTWLRFQLGSSPAARGLPSGRNLSALHAVQVPGPTIIREAETTDGGVAMGWFAQAYRGHRLIVHWGGASGPTVRSFMPDDGLGVCVHSNRAESSFHAINAIMLSALDRLLGLQPLPWAQRWSVPMAAAQSASHTHLRSEGLIRPAPSGMANLVGRYAHPGYGCLEIRDEPTGPGLYYQGLRFGLDADGEDIQLTLSSRVPRALTGWWGTRRAAIVRTADGKAESIAIPFEPAIRAITFVRIANSQGDGNETGTSSRSAA